MTEKLKCLIRKAVLDANRKMTPREVAVSVAREAGTDRQTVRLSIRDLVRQGELTYTYDYGASFLAPSFDKPVRVSKRIVIKPPDQAYRPAGGDVVIDLARGAAFGDGTHPTTCLALRALEAILDNTRCKDGKASSKALDIGTGTGVLAIALAKLGVQKVVAIDIDPCAICEARENVALNRLAEQVTISSTRLEALGTYFSIIVANLAYPTLIRMLHPMLEKMEDEGVLVISGLKAPASKGLVEAYAEQGLTLIHEETDREWVCCVLRKAGQRS